MIHIISFYAFLFLMIDIITINMNTHKRNNMRKWKKAKKHEENKKNKMNNGEKKSIFEERKIFITIQ